MNDRLSRRRFLQVTAAAGAGLLVAPRIGLPDAWARIDPLDAARSAEAWAQADAILARVKAPVFPGRDFDILKFGAIGDGAKDCTTALRDAIAACHAAGGGRVMVPAGIFLTGAIRLKSGVNLHVASGATLRFSRDPRQYLPLVHTRWEGVELMNYSPFIYAFEEDRVAVTGEGTLDGLPRPLACSAPRQPWSSSGWRTTHACAFGSRWWPRCSAR